MTLDDLIANGELVLLEAAVIERLRRETDLPLHPLLENAPFVLDDAGRKALQNIYGDYLALARRAASPLILCTPTWRANRERLGTSGVQMDLNRRAALFMREIVAANPASPSGVFIGGLMGCKHDCYRPGEALRSDEALQFHSWQAGELASGGVDFLMAATIPSVEEASGMALAMASTGLPYIVSFVIGPHGSVLDGNSCERAFELLDKVTASNPPLGYMINCSYPTFLKEGSMARLIGFQANASSLDQLALDNSTTTLRDDPREWAACMAELHRKRGVNILGGCCGTTTEHLQLLLETLER